MQVIAKEGDNLENVFTSLEKVSNVLFDWFKNNCLKINFDKFQALVSTIKHLNVKINN